MRSRPQRSACGGARRARRHEHRRDRTGAGQLPALPLRPTLSALVVARNEEIQLADCLSCLGFADEIVVVLDRCDDARPRSPGGSPTGSSRAPGSARGTGAMPGSRRAAATGSSKSTPTNGSARSLRPKSAAVVAHSAADWHLIRVDNYIGDRLVRWGWGASFGRSAHAGLFRRGAKRWGEGRVHPAIALSGSQGPTLGAPLAHYVDRNISDMLRRLDRYTSARARDLRDSGDIGSFAHNLRRIFSRFWKCYVARPRLSRRRMGFSDRAVRGALPDPVLSEGAARKPNDGR